ncbi:hypothetical protein KUTeg_017023 [Tegillarca granosa]|uniref:Phosphatidic acid phosphatase type 2/haloperoxidase domain-containing protein n=1 Tax=Tegillarca granosa TaxID=220873 RepID=A0ABQ9ET58_TEGGR|nr:hypothetical protein KUTeg_017023 [Tegillarca granosa]
MYPYRDDTIPDPILLAGGFSIPFAIILLVELPKCLLSQEKRVYNRDFVIMWKVLWVYSFGFTITEIFIQGPKFAIGGLRPHFLEVCKPDACISNSTIRSYVTDYTCTETKYGEKVLWQSRQSFPSGHAAFSMYGAIFTGIIAF